MGLGPEGSGPRLGTPKHLGGVRLSWRLYAMGTDPKICREHALRCTELAERATDQTLKAVLSELAERWLKAAD